MGPVSFQQSVVCNELSTPTMSPDSGDGAITRSNYPQQLHCITFLLSGRFYPKRCAKKGISGSVEHTVQSRLDKLTKKLLYSHEYNF